MKIRKSGILRHHLHKDKGCWKVSWPLLMLQQVHRSSSTRRCKGNWRSFPPQLSTAPGTGKTEVINSGSCVQCTTAPDERMLQNEPHAFSNLNFQGQNNIKIASNQLDQLLTTFGAQWKMLDATLWILKDKFSRPNLYTQQLKTFLSTPSSEFLMKAFQKCLQRNTACKFLHIPDSKELRKYVPIDREVWGWPCWPQSPAFW